MNGVFEIIEKDEIDWVQIMMCDYKEEVYEGVTAYLIKKEPLMEYIVCNKDFDKCIIIKSDIMFHVYNFLVYFDMQYFIESPDFVKGLKTYNLTKMTNKCFKFRLRCRVRRILEFIFDIFDDFLGLLGGSEISIIILIIVCLMIAGISIKFLTVGGI